MQRPSAWSSAQIDAWAVGTVSCFNCVCFSIYLWHVYLSDTVISDTFLSDAFSIIVFHKKENIIIVNRLRKNRWRFKGKLRKSLEKNLAHICVSIHCLINMTMFLITIWIDITDHQYLMVTQQKPLPCCGSSPRKWWNYLLVRWTSSLANPILGESHYASLHQSCFCVEYLLPLKA